MLFVRVILDPFPARVMRALDGDALQVAPHDAPHRPLRVRIAWLDVPEKGHYWAANAHTAMQAFTAMRDALIFPVAYKGRCEDRWGRIVARVIISGEDLTSWALAHGHGKYWTRHGLAPDHEHYQAMEAMAKSAIIGVWTGPRVPR